MTITPGQAKPFPYSNYKSLGTWNWPTIPQEGAIIATLDNEPVKVVKVTSGKIYLDNNRYFTR